MTDIFVRKRRIKPGKTRRLKDRVEELAEETETHREGVIERWGEDGLHTLSLFVEHGADHDYLLWYFEVDSRERLLDGGPDAAKPLDDLGSELLADAQDETETVGEFEPLFHAVNPIRPKQFIVQQ
jgi:hypothetical protein